MVGRGASAAVEGTDSVMARAAASKRKRGPPASDRAGAAARCRARLPALEQHQRDLIGLGLVAFGCFLAVVLYGGETGGRVGEAVDGRRCASCSAESPIWRRWLRGRRSRAGRARPAAVAAPVPHRRDLPGAGAGAGPGGRLARARARGAAARAAARRRVRVRPRRRARRAAVLGVQHAVLRRRRPHPVRLPDGRRRAAADRRLARGRRARDRQRRRHDDTRCTALDRRADRGPVGETGP